MYQTRVIYRLGFLLVLFFSAATCYVSNAQAATSSDGVWADVVAKSRSSRSSDEMMVKGVQDYRLVHLDWDKVNTILSNTPLKDNDGPILELPVPSGEFAKFRIWESSVMAPELAAKFPEIKTYTGQGIDDPTATVKISVTPENGFQAMILSALRGTIYLDPYTKGDRGQYIVYYRKDFKVDDDFRLQQKEDHIRKQSHGVLQRSTLQKVNFGTQLKTYRLAVVATGEYTQFHGGTVASAQTAIVTAINRVTGVYERDFSIKLQLVDNSAFVFTDPATDGLTNTDVGALINEIKPIIDAAITVNGYDIGHVFSTSSGGIAAVGVVCGPQKTEGGTGLPSPTGDPFYIDFVAHEMAHQFGADHTFNGTQGACDNTQRSMTKNFEPGSGTTIVSYAGICDSDNIIAPNGDDYMHGSSIEEVFNYSRNDATGMSCGTTTATGNSIPTVDAGPATNPAFTIPRRTPFELIGTATDANGDTLTYTWEQFNGAQTPGQLPSEPVAFDPNNAVTNEPADNGPIFRSFPPNASATRVFPRLSDLLNNQIPKGEVLPSTTRDLTFLLTVRDNRAGGGGVNQDDLFMRVDANSGPFIVTAPNTAVTWNSGTQQTVTWNVANTTAAPVSCANVDITLSTDGGNTFATSLAASTPNDGSEQITVPAATSSTARVKVKCSNNVFFDFSNVNFNIGGSAPEIEVSGNSVVIADGDITPSVTDHTDFGSTAVAGGTVMRTFTVKNTGTGNLNLTGTPIVAVSGANAADFTVTAQPTTPVAAAGMTTFVVSFDPSAAGARNATLTIANNDADENPTNFNILGTGTVPATNPEIEITGNNLVIVDGDITPSVTDHTDFGSTAVAGGTIARTFTIRNTGTGDLNLTGTPTVAISGTNAADFAVTTQPTTPVAAAGMTTFVVTFDPGAAGARTAALSIANNDSDENPSNYNISGTGTTVVVDNDGVSDAEENAAPNSGDGNNDGTADSTQSQVASLSGKTAGSYYTVAVSNGCSQITSASTTTEAALSNDTGFDYPVGLVQFTLNCNSAQVMVYFHGLTTAPTQIRKYGKTPTSAGANVWYTIPATITTVTIPPGTGSTVYKATYNLVDGQLGDDDLTVNGIIVDPVGPAILVAAPPLPVPGVTNAIPTLSEWAQILLMIMMMVTAVAIMIRTRTTY